MVLETKVGTPPNAPVGATTTTGPPPVGTSSEEIQKSDNETILTKVILPQLPTPRAPLPVRQKDDAGLLLFPEEAEDPLLAILQNSVKETYLAFKGNSAKRKVS